MSVTMSLRPVLLLGLTLVACAPQQNGARERLCAGNGCTEECKRLQVDVCDIRERECQDVIFKSLQCVRGRVLDETPNIEFVDELASGSRNTPEDLEARSAPPANSTAGTSAPSVPSVAPMQGSTTTTGTGVEPASERQAKKLAEAVLAYYVNEGVRLLHFIPPNTTIEDATDKEEEQNGAVEMDGQVKVEVAHVDFRWLSMQLLAHEFVHAQQEVNYGGIQHLFEIYAKTAKSRQSVKAFIEGEAELYAWLTHAFMRNQSVDDWALLDYFDESAMTLRRRTVGDSTPWTSVQSRLHYPIGARVLAERWLSGHNLAVQSVRHNLVPDFGAWARNLASPIGKELGDGVNCAPRGTQMVVRDRLGPSGVFALLMAASSTRKLQPVEPAWQIAKSLVDDRLEFFAQTLPEGETQASWLARTCVSDQPSDEGPLPDAGAKADAGQGDAGAAVDAGFVDASSVTPERPVREDCTGVNASSDDAADVTTLPYAQLMPEGPVWLSWRLSFDTNDDAVDFVEFFAGLDWQKVEVLQKDATVLVKGRRKPVSDAEQSSFDTWDAWEVCKVE